MEETVIKQLVDKIMLYIDAKYDLDLASNEDAFKEAKKYVAFIKQDITELTERLK